MRTTTGLLISILLGLFTAPSAAQYEEYERRAEQARRAAAKLEAAEAAIPMPKSQKLSESDACRIASARVLAMATRNPEMLDQKVLACTNFESRSDQGWARITVPVTFRWRGARQSEGSQSRCEFRRLDQGWKLNGCSS